MELAENKSAVPQGFLIFKNIYDNSMQWPWRNYLHKHNCSLIFKPTLSVYFPPWISFTSTSLYFEETAIKF